MLRLTYIQDLILKSVRDFPIASNHHQNLQQMTLSNFGPAFRRLDVSLKSKNYQNIRTLEAMTKKQYRIYAKSIPQNLFKMLNVAFLIFVSV